MKILKILVILSLIIAGILVFSIQNSVYAQFQGHTSKGSCWTGVQLDTDIRGGLLLVIPILWS